MYGDGGGKAPSWPQPIYGRERVAKLMAGTFAQAMVSARRYSRRSSTASQASVSSTTKAASAPSCHLTIADGADPDDPRVHEPRQTRACRTRCERAGFCARTAASGVLIIVPPPGRSRGARARGRRPRLRGRGSRRRPGGARSPRSHRGPRGCRASSRAPSSRSPAAAPSTPTTPTHDPRAMRAGPEERRHRDDHHEPAVVRALRPVEAHGPVVRPGAEHADDRDGDRDRRDDLRPRAPGDTACSFLGQ